MFAEDAMSKGFLRENRGVDAVGGYTVFFDGCCEPRNPGGTAGYGAIIYKGDKEVWRHAGMLPASPTNSNNVAEYLGLNAALDWLMANGLTDQPILVKGDSQLVINQCLGKWQIKAACMPNTLALHAPSYRVFLRYV